jgi:hypothetical protein
LPSRKTSVVSTFRSSSRSPIVSSRLGSREPADPRIREPAGVVALSPGLRLVHADGTLSATPAAAPSSSRAPPLHA